MNTKRVRYDWETLQEQMAGEIVWDKAHQMLYATDASVYRMLPTAVAFPKTDEDLPLLLAFCHKHQLGFIPRTAGTSLAGQCVGEGLVVDFSKHMQQILAFDPEAQEITVQPGIIRDELNQFLAPYGLFFGPNTSTSNRCMIGGMVGNNSSGTTSIRYGVTRDKVKRIQGFLADGSPVDFGPTDLQTAQNSETPGGRMEVFLHNLLADSEIQNEVRAQYPKASVHRRNNGYPLDLLLEQQPLNPKSSTPFNVAPFLCGTEGTLVVSTAITLKLDTVPPVHQRLVAAHFHSVEASLRSVAGAMAFGLYTCELMDKIILDCTRNNREQAQNRSFVEGDPHALLFLEVREASSEAADAAVDELVAFLQSSTEAYAYPVLKDKACAQAFDLRSAGLGLLGNIIGDDKAVACIEDTAVPLEQLSAYIEDFGRLMEDFGQEVVYYAHAGAGELHLRPILNLKKQKDVADFKAITHAVARLVKSYGGAMSGEHGDGIVRSETLPTMLGTTVYSLLERVKSTFDPNHLLNPGKIVNPLPMGENLRYVPERREPEVPTFLNFSKEGGLLRAAEKCNGSGDCRKTTEVGVLCPSYRATKNEIDSTRGRANILREVLTNREKPFQAPELEQAFDLCISCKACVSECPSTVDIAVFKAEYLYQKKQVSGARWRDYLFAYSGKINAWNARMPGLFNGMIGIPWVQKGIKALLGIASERSLLKLERSIYKKLKSNSLKEYDLYLYLDEFSNFQETQIAFKTYDLLQKLGYQVGLMPPTESGRTYISKGFLKEARRCAERNLEIYRNLISADCPLVGIEPSAILTFSDEYPQLVADSSAAEKLGAHCLTIESFLAAKIRAGHIRKEQFTSEVKQIKVHTHCYQKALGKSAETLQILGFPKNYTVSLLSAGCCGMAGSFGFEKEHYAVSQSIGEDRLFPALRKTDQTITLAANGTSCRHQIREGVGRTAKHPVEILHEAWVESTSGIPLS